MTYETREESVYAGAPVELYKFVAGATSYFYTSADVDVTYLGDVYVSAILERPRIVQTDEIAPASIGVDIPDTHPLALLFRDVVPIQPVAATIFRDHRGEGDYQTIWVGQVGTTKFEGGRATLVLTSLRSKLTRKIPRMIVGRTCQNMLYDGRCQVVPATYAYTAGTVTAITNGGLTVTVSGAATFAGSDPTYFAGGILLKGGVVLAYIVDQSGDDMQLLNVPSGLIVTDAVTLYAGCDRAIDTCFSKFANVAHFNGWHAIPTRNPFEGRGLAPPYP